MTDILSNSPSYFEGCGIALGELDVKEVCSLKYLFVFCDCHVMTVDVSYSVYSGPACAYWHIIYIYIYT